MTTLLFTPGQWVRKTRHHRFYGRVISSGFDDIGVEHVTVQHWPDRWVFHFRADLLEESGPPDTEFVAQVEVLREAVKCYLESGEAP